jgi:hypothetical protein
MTDLPSVDHLASGERMSVKARTKRELITDAGLESARVPRPNMAAGCVG